MNIDINDSRLDEAIALFNSQEFFQCHDVLEELWSETVSADRQLLQGLIHAAVSLFHLTEGNFGGARKMHDSTVRYLAPFQPEGLTIDLSRFLQDYEVIFRPLLGEQTEYPTGLVIDESLIPRWHRSSDWQAEQDR